MVLGTYRDHVAHHEQDESSPDGGPGTAARPGTAPEGGPAEGGPDEDGETWVALLHRPGPAAPEGAALFADPRFAEHVAFLTRMRDARLPGHGRPADRRAG